MEAKEIEQLVDELELRVERLRILFDQYFMGIEKIPPGIAQKDVDRRIWVLRRERIRNTGIRFRFQTLTYRYNTYQARWQRICREIENGTYKRDRRRAKERFTDRTPDSMPPPSIELDLDVEVDFADEDSTPAPAIPALKAPAQSGDLSDILAAALGQAILPAGPRQNVSSPSVAVGEQREKPLRPSTEGQIRPAPNLAPVSLYARPATQIPARPTQIPQTVPGPSQERGLYGRPTGLIPTRGAPTLPAPASSTQALTQAPAALTQAPAALTQAPAALTQAPAALTQTPVAPALNRAHNAPTQAPPTTPAMMRPNLEAHLPGPTPAARPAMRPMLAPSMAKATAAGETKSTPTTPVVRTPQDDTYRNVYERLVETRRKNGESTAGLTYESLAKNMRDTTEKLRERAGGRDIAFDVVTKDGKTILKPTVK